MLRDEESFARARDRDGMRWFFDPEGEIGRLYGALGETAPRTPDLGAGRPVAARAVQPADEPRPSSCSRRLRALPAARRPRRACRCTRR